MSVKNFKRGIPTYKDKDNNEFGLLCETKEVCVTDDDGVSLEHKLQNLLQSISDLTSELQSCAKKDDLLNYFPKSGGTVTGSITIETDSAKERGIIIGNSLRRSGLLTSDYGTITLYDATNRQAVFESSVDGKNTWNGTATGNLPLTGGKIAAAKREPLTIENTTEGASAVDIIFRINGANMGQLGYNSAGEPYFYSNKMSASYKFLHTGNSAKVVISETAPSDTSALWVW